METEYWNLHQCNLALAYIKNIDDKSIHNNVAFEFIYRLKSKKIKECEKLGLDYPSPEELEKVILLKVAESQKQILNDLTRVFQIFTQV